MFRRKAISTGGEVKANNESGGLQVAINAWSAWLSSCDLYCSKPFRFNESAKLGKFKSDNFCEKSSG